MDIRAYSERYVARAQDRLGDAFDYAINSCDIAGEDFMQMFAGSSVSRRMGKADPKYIPGKSGIEIALDVIKEATGKELHIEPKVNYGRSPEYWMGWALAYYQWCSDRQYKDIFKVVSYKDLQRMYYTLHEADVTKFADIIDKLMREHFAETNLKRFRGYTGMTQSELACRSGVSLRSIQMYEQRHKDINKASVETVYKLAKVFGCAVEDLLEH